MKNIIELPKKIAICFVGGDNKRTLEQKTELSDIEDFFEIEWYLRSDIYSGEYWTFSQIVNEAIIYTDSEFMVFINPKSIVNKEDILEIINDLCSGYCWSGLISFGLWGATKELFRHIGLMDERFLSSEYEDNDFALRLKQFGKAIKWHSRFENYKQILSVRRKLFTHSIFYKKWLLDNKDNIFYLVDIYKENKQLPPIIKNNYKEYIYNSWYDMSKSDVTTISHVAKMYSKHTVSDRILKSEKRYEIINIKITYNGEYIEGYYNGNKYNFITLTSINVITNLYSFEFGKAISWKNNNGFKSKLISDKKAITLTLIHEGMIIYDNQLIFPPFNLDINIGLSINTVVGFL